MSEPALEPLLTPVQVAERCQISTKTVLRAIRSGRLRACRLGTRGAYRVTVRDVDAWIEAATVRPVDQETRHVEASLDARHCSRAA